ncbi:MAG: hypothetical protein EBX78_04665 [Gammaproteobacteria bacterium]|nr:hypothetical protein [Gammaproteobacteria bacterium]
MLEGLFGRPLCLQELATPTLLWLLLLTLAVVAFSSGTEVAMLAANRYRARAQAATGSRRAKLLLPLAQTDGLFVIDSDPGGYPHSTNAEFVYILGAHRRVLDRLRPGIELIYWAHFGWEAYGRFYATGELKRGDPAEPCEAITLLARQRAEPWGVATSGFETSFADAIGMGGRVLGFPYGAIEAEPSFPFTNFGGDKASNGGRRGGARGVLGNSQTHCVQLPNTFAFSRAAQGLSATRADYVTFANDLIPGQGEKIVAAWEALQTEDAARMKSAAAALTALPRSSLAAGPLRGLLFGDAGRFIRDLELQLAAAGTLFEFRAALDSAPRNSKTVATAFAAFTAAVDAWQRQHGYSGHWRWPAMQDALRKFDSAPINRELDTLTFLSPVGATPFEKVKNGLADLESYSLRLIAAMKRVAAEMAAQP